MKSFIFLFFFAFSLVFSQDGINNNLTNKDFIKQLKNEFKTYNDSLKTLTKANKTIIKFHKNQQKLILKNIKNQDYLVKSKYHSFLETIVSEIIKENELLFKNKKISVLVDNSPNLNAAFIGYNIILINVGLFVQLDSREQIKAIIAHELSHLVLNHHKKVIDKKVEYSQLKDYKKNIFSLKLNKKSNLELIELYKKYKYDFATFKRTQEYESDSLSLKLLSKNSNFLELYKDALKKISENYFSNHSRLKKETFYNIFELNAIKNNENWFLNTFKPIKNMVEQDFETHLNRDSVRTHPRIDFRISKLNKIYNKYFLHQVPSTSFSSLINSNEFLNLKKESLQDSSEILYQQNQYFKSLYFNLLQFQDFSNFGKTNELIINNLSFFLELKQNNKLETYFDNYTIAVNNTDYLLIINYLLNSREEDLTKLILALKQK